MIESAQNLKNRGAKKVYLVATFALFTEGIEKFNEAYNEGIFTKLYVTNLSYVPEEIKSKEWYTEVDCSILLARIINKLNKKESIAEIYDQGRNRLN